MAQCITVARRKVHAPTMLLLIFTDSTALDFSAWVQEGAKGWDYETMKPSAVLLRRATSCLKLIHPVISARPRVIPLIPTIPT